MKTEAPTVHWVVLRYKWFFYLSRKIEVQVPCIPYLFTDVINCVLIITVLSEFYFRQRIVNLLINFHVTFLLLSWILSGY